MRPLTRASLAVLVLVLALCCNSCWNRREVETLAFVMAAGLDYLPESDELALTVQVAKPQLLMGGAGSQRPIVVATSRGRTLFEAVRNIIQQSPERLFWAHNGLVVFGELMSARGVLPYLDFLVRDGETRSNVAILVADGATAEEVLEAEYELEPVAGRALLSHLRFALNSLGTSPYTNMRDLLISLETEGLEPLAPRVQVTRKTEGDNEGKLLREVVFTSPILGGAAVFRDDRVVGMLEPLEARGVGWVKGKGLGGIVVVPAPGGGGLVSMEILGTSSKVKVTLAEGEPKASIKIGVKANLGDVQTPLAPLYSAEFIEELEQNLAKAVRSEVEMALARCQREFRSDVFGFGSVLHRQQPDLWAEVAGSWTEVFASLQVEVEVEAHLQNAGFTGRSITPK